MRVHAQENEKRQQQGREKKDQGGLEDGEGGEEGAEEEEEGEEEEAPELVACKKALARATLHMALWVQMANGNHDMDLRR